MVCLRRKQELRFPRALKRLKALVLRFWHYAHDKREKFPVDAIARQQFTRYAGILARHNICAG